MASVSSFFACSASASPRRISVRVRLNSVKPTLPEIPISFSSERRERSSLRASLADSPCSAPLEPAGLALQRRQPLDGVADIVDQALLPRSG